MKECHLDFWKLACLELKGIICHLFTALSLLNYQSAWFTCECGLCVYLCVCVCVFRSVDWKM